MRAAEVVEIRRAGLQDLHGVLGVHARRDPGGPLGDGPTVLQQRTWDEMMSRDGLAVYVAELDGEPVGTATVVLMPNLTYQCAPTAFIEAVVVDHRHRRRGIATAILHRVLDDARAAGCNKVQLLSHKRHADDGGHDLYATVGFEPEAEGFRRYLGPRPAAIRGTNS